MSRKYIIYIVNSQVLPGNEAGVWFFFLVIYLFSEGGEGRKKKKRKNIKYKNITCFISEEKPCSVSNQR